MKNCFGYDSVSVLPIVVQNVGLYSETASSTPITNTITETTLIDGGVGTLTVPANGFSIGDSYAFEGADFVTINNTTFDTTIANTLNITAQWGNASLQNSIYTDILNLYKIY